MNNENMKNYYNLLEGKLQIFEAKEDEFLRNQWQDDINLAKEELHDNYFERIYYQIFVDKFLVNVIETIINKLSGKIELDSKHCIRLEFTKRRLNEPSDKVPNFQNVAFRVVVPTISSNSIMVEIGFKGEYKFDEMLKNFNELFDKTYNHISTYTDISISNVNFSEPLVHTNCFYYTYTRIISFECTLKDLINMYYMEKQRQEYENYDARKKKIKQK